KRKVDPTVVEGVLHELLQTPLAGPTELGPRVQARLGRDDLTVANIACALEQISCVPVLRTLRQQLETGHVHYQEAWLLTEVLENLSLPAPQLAGWNGPSPDRGMQVADPTAPARAGAQPRSGDAGRRSHRARGAGDPRAAARAGAWLSVLADVPYDPVLLECAAVGIGPLVWRS